MLGLEHFVPLWPDVGGGEFSIILSTDGVSPKSEEYYFER